MGAWTKKFFLCCDTGLDFDNSTHYITIRKNDEEQIRFDIAVTRDDIRERDEVFLLLVTLHKLEGAVPVRIGQDTAKAVIKDSSKLIFHMKTAVGMSLQVLRSRCSCTKQNSYSY